MSNETMTIAERRELRVLLKAHRAVAVEHIQAWEAAQIAQGEAQLSADYEFDDALWADVYTDAAVAVAVADKQIGEICAGLGIPAKFRPRISIGWEERGENILAERRTELRLKYQAEVRAQARQARATVEARYNKALVTLLSSALASDEARAFLAAMPNADELLTSVSLVAIDQQLAHDDDEPLIDS